MNSVSPETLAAEKQIGDILGKPLRPHLCHGGRPGPAPVTAAERPSRSPAGEGGSARRPGLRFHAFRDLPGEERASQNLQAWRAFWNPERAAELRGAIPVRFPGSWVLHRTPLPPS